MYELALGDTIRVQVDDGQVQVCGDHDEQVQNKTLYEWVHVDEDGVHCCSLSQSSCAFAHALA